MNKSYICRLDFSRKYGQLFSMEHELKKEGRYKYFESGEGTPIIILHGLMGGLSNFDGVANFFPAKGYKVVIPELPIYTQSLLKTNVKAFSNK